MKGRKYIFDMLYYTSENPATFVGFVFSLSVPVLGTLFFRIDELIWEISAVELLGVTIGFIAGLFYVQARKSYTHNSISDICTVFIVAIVTALSMFAYGKLWLSEGVAPGSYVVSVLASVLFGSMGIAFLIPILASLARQVGDAQQNKEKNKRKAQGYGESKALSNRHKGREDG